MKLRNPPFPNFSDASTGMTYKKSSFNLRPLLLSVTQNTNPSEYELTIILFFYSLYISIWGDKSGSNISKKIFLLPILFYWSFDAVAKSLLTFLFGPLLMYKSFEDTKYMHVFPFYFQRSWSTQDIFQCVFPVFWKYKQKETWFSCVLPFYWFYKTSKLHVEHLFPFFGYKHVTGDKPEEEYTEYSILYPFNRYIKYKSANIWQLHVTWPFLKIKKREDYQSMRIFPFTWIRRSNKGYSGYILLFYMKHHDSGERKYTYWGIAAIFHFKWEEKEGVERKITYFLLLYFHRKIPKYEFRYVTPFFITYYEKNNPSDKDYKFILKLISPFYYYYKKQFTEIVLVPILYFSLEEQAAKKTFTVYNLLYYVYNADGVSRKLLLPCFYSASYIDKVSRVWILLYYSEWEGETYLFSVFFPLIWYHRKKTNHGETTYQNIWVFPVYHSRYDSGTAIEEKLNGYLLILWIGYNQDPKDKKKFDHWVYLLPLIYYRKDAFIDWNISVSFKFLPLLYYHNSYSTQDAPMSGSLLLLPVFYYSWTVHKLNTEYLTIIVPVYYNENKIKEKEVDKTLGILLIFWYIASWNDQIVTDLYNPPRKSFKYYILPLFFHGSDYVNGSDGVRTEKTTLIVPIWYSHFEKTRKVDNTKIGFLLLGWYSNLCDDPSVPNYHPKNHSSSFIIFPFIWRFSEVKGDIVNYSLKILPVWVCEIRSTNLDYSSWYWICLLYKYDCERKKDASGVEMLSSRNIFLFPLVWMWYTKDQSDFVLILPFYLHEKSATRHAFVYLFLYYTAYNLDGSFLWIRLIPFYYKEHVANSHDSLQVFPFYWYHKDAKSTERRLFSNYTYTDEKIDIHQIFIFYKSSCDKKKIGYTIFTPFLYYYQKNVSDTLTTCMLIYWSYVDAVSKTMVVLPLYANVIKSQNNTISKPINDQEPHDDQMISLNSNDSTWKWIFVYYYSKNATSEITIVFPFYFNVIDKDSAWKLIMGYFWSKSIEHEIWTFLIVAKYIHTNPTDQGKTQYLVVFPFFMQKIMQDNTWNLLPCVLFFIQRGTHPILIFFPFYISITQTNWNFLFFWFYGCLKIKDEENVREHTWKSYLTFVLITKEITSQTNTHFIRDHFLFVFVGRRTVWKDENQSGKWIYLLPMFNYSKIEYKDNDVPVFDYRLYLFLLLTLYNHKTSSCDDKKLLISPITLYYRNLTGVFVMNLLFTYYNFINTKVFVSLFHMSFEKHDDHYSFKKTRLILFGLIGSDFDHADVHDKRESYWIGLLLIWVKTDDFTSLISFPFLWHFQNETRARTILIPFFMRYVEYETDAISGNADWYVLAILSFFRSNWNEKHYTYITSYSLITKLEYDGELGTTDIRFIYLFTWCLFRYVVERTSAYRGSHIAVTKCYLLGIWYYLSKDLYTISKTNYASHQGDGKINFWTNKYTPDVTSNESSLLFGWISSELGLMGYTWENERRKRWMFLVFFTDWTLKPDGESHKKISVGWIFDPQFALYHRDDYSLGTETRSIGTIALIFHSKIERTTTSEDIMYSMFYLFDPFLALIKHKVSSTFNEGNMNTRRSLTYVIPLFMKFRSVKGNSVHDYLNIVWIAWKYISIFGNYKKSVDSKMTSHMTWLNPILYHFVSNTASSQTSVFKLFFVWFKNEIGLALFFKYKLKNSTTDQEIIHAFPWFYYIYSHDTTTIAPNKMSYLNFLWLFERDFALIGKSIRSEINTGSDHYQFYIYPLFLRQIERQPTYRHDLISMFYTINSWLALFFYSKLQAKGDASQVEIQVDETKQDFSLSYSGPTVYKMYLWCLFDLRLKKVDQVWSRYQIYFFYLFYRQVALVQSWKRRENDVLFQGWYAIPLFYKYQHGKELGWSFGWISRKLALIHSRGNQDEETSLLYMFLIFHKTQEKSNKRLYMFWLFNRMVSLVEFWDVNDSTWTGTYIFFFLYRSNIFDSSEPKKLTCNVFAMFWIGNPWIALVNWTQRIDLVGKNQIIFYITGLVLKERVHVSENEQHESIQFFWILTGFKDLIQTAALIKSTHSKVGTSENSMKYVFPWFIFIHSKQDDTFLKRLSICWLFHSSFSIYHFFEETKDVKGIKSHSKKMYLLVFFHYKRKEVAGELRKLNLYVFWFFHKRFALLQQWNWHTNPNKVSSITTSGFYVIWLMRKEITPSMKSFALFWLFSHTIAIFHKSENILDKEYKSYLFSIYFWWKSQSESQVYVFWFCYYLIAFFRYKFEESTTGVVSETSSFVLIFDYIKLKRGEISLELEVHILYFFWKKLSLISYWNEFDHEYRDRGVTILFLMKWKDQVDSGVTTTLYAFFWFFHEFLSLVYSKKVSVEGNYKLDSYIFFYFYLEKDTKEELHKIAVFWLIVRQASFIRISWDKQDVKYLFFPIFKYQRKRGKSSKWCLFPLIPVKYSFKACVLLYKKKVMARGTQLDLGIEDKSQRKNRSIVRFLYLVFVWSRDENGLTVVQWNPFYFSRYEPEFNLYTWRVFGGLFGQEEYVSKSKEKKRRDCRLLCCCNIPMLEEVVVQ